MPTTNDRDTSEEKDREWEANKHANPAVIVLAILFIIAIIGFALLQFFGHNIIGKLF